MKLRPPLARAVATTATLAVAATGALVLAPPAQAALVPTDYGFYTSAFGTHARAELVGLSSGRTAWSTIGCTRLAGKKQTKSLAAVQTPGNIPTLGIGAIVSTSQTFKENGNSGARSTNRIANVRIGLPQGPNLVITGLETTSSAWADRKGKLHTSSSFKLADIQSNTGIGPVDQLLNRVGVTVGDLVKVIQSSTGGKLEIPGVGRISLGAKNSRIKANWADINTVSLKVHLYGLNLKPGGGDDVVVVIGRSYAKVIKNMPAGVMGGTAYAADVSVLNGLLGINELARKPLACQGTGGRVVSSQLAGGQNIAKFNMLGLGVAQSRVYGKQYPNGSALAWTEGSLARLNLNLLGTRIGLKGIVGRATIRKTHKGKLVKSTAGTQLGSLTINGKEISLKSLQRDLKIPGIATIKFGVTKKGPRAVRVTAVRIVLLPAVSAQTGLAKIDLGVAKVRMRRL